MLPGGIKYYPVFTPASGLLGSASSHMGVLALMGAGRIEAVIIAAPPASEFRNSRRAVFSLVVMLVNLTVKKYDPERMQEVFFVKEGL